MRNGHQLIMMFIIFACMLWGSIALADNFSTDNFSAGNTGANTIGANTAGAKKCNSKCGAGDGFPNPDEFGVSGHGAALSYKINSDGTFTDNNTGLTWEIKTNVSGSVHNVNNTYQWSSNLGGTDADGTLFTVFLKTLNNSCAGDETTPCTSNLDCTGIGNGKCGFAGHRDWCIPNIKRLLSIVDFTTRNPASSIPGLTGSAFPASSPYWSSTTDNLSFTNVWTIDFITADVSAPGKGIPFFARAVRPCSP